MEPRRRTAPLRRKPSPTAHSLAGHTGVDALLPAGLAAPDALREFGLLVAIAIRLHPDDEADRRRRRLAIPPPQIGWGLVDTGTSHTVIDAKVVKALRLGAIGQTAVTASLQREWTARSLYRGCIEWRGRKALPPCPVERMMEGELSDNQGLIALIGRDVLQGFVLVCDGITGRFALFPQKELGRQPRANAGRRQRMSPRAVGVRKRSGLQRM